MKSKFISETVLDSKSRKFYSQAIAILKKSEIPFLIGGAYAFARYTEIGRHTKDLDIFVRSNDCPRILEIFSQAGYQTEMSAPHWLGKAFCGENFLDVIFYSANGCCEVDEGWFERGVKEEFLGVPVLICSPEDIIWSKAFVMARDRFDGADIAHLILACSDRLDWLRLIQCFGTQWRVLLSHLILFGFIYPGEGDRIPGWVMDELCDRLQQEANSPSPTEKTCQGTLLAPMQYRIDVEQWGYQDARLRPLGNMTAAQIERWSNHLKKEKETGILLDRSSSSSGDRE